MVLDLASTPVLRQRMARAESVTEAMFAQIVLADDRAVVRTVSGGRTVYEAGRN